MAIGAAVSAEALTLQEARQVAVDNYPPVRDYDLITLPERYNLQNAAKAWLPQRESGSPTTVTTDYLATESRVGCAGHVADRRVGVS